MSMLYDNRGFQFFDCHFFNVEDMIQNTKTISGFIEKIFSPDKSDIMTGRYLSILFVI